jgi:hypothetical protein
MRLADGLTQVIGDLMLGEQWEIERRTSASQEEKSGKVIADLGKPARTVDD